MSQRVLSFTVWVFCGLLMAACATTEEYRVNKPALAAVKSIGITTKVESEFSVFLHRLKPPSAAASMFGAIGLGLDAASKASKDGNLEDSLRPLIASYRPDKILAENVRHQLEEHKKFSKLEFVSPNSAPELNQAGLDARLQVTLKTWGLQACSFEREEQMVRVSAKVLGELVSSSDKNVIFTRSEVYQTPDCQPIESYKSSDDMLTRELSGAIETLAGKIVNRVVYP